MINFGKVLLKKSKLSLEDMRNFISLPIDSNTEDIPIYSYDENIQIMSTYELEQSIKHIPIKDQVIHSIAHIEYNAMKSYIDTLVRFINQVPAQFQKEFKEDLGQIAFEEFQHFELVNQLCQYGSQPVHNNLQKRMMLTMDSLLGRLAILSIVNEGRGMDTGLNLISKLEGDIRYEKVITVEISRFKQIFLKFFVISSMLSKKSIPLHHFEYLPLIINFLIQLHCLVQLYYTQIHIYYQSCAVKRQSKRKVTMLESDLNGLNDQMIIKIPRNYF